MSDDRKKTTTTQKPHWFHWLHSFSQSYFYSRVENYKKKYKRAISPQESTVSLWSRLENIVFFAGRRRPKCLWMPLIVPDLMTLFVYVSHCPFKKSNQKKVSQIQMIASSTDSIFLLFPPMAALSDLYSEWKVHWVGMKDKYYTHVDELMKT